MKVPKKIRDKLDPEMLSKIDREQRTSSSDYIKVFEVKERDVKERTRKILWEVYRNEGYQRFMSLIADMKTFKNYDFNDIIQVKGETAEVVLEIIIHQFIKEHCLNWRLYKGLILSPDPGKEGTTELDLVLVSPVVVSIIEIKSYNGDKVLTGDCFMETKNGEYVTKKDIFSQNCLHIRAFWNNFYKFALADVGIIKSVMFSFARGTLSDKRSMEKREIMPVYDEITVSSYLEALRSINSSPRWKGDELIAAIEKMESEAPSLSDHIAYLRSKYGDNN